MVGTLIRRLPVIANPATDSAAGILETATQAEQETATAVDKTVTPGRQQFHPSAAKAWVLFDISGGLYTSYNVASVTDNGTGNWTVNIAADFSTANYVGMAFGGFVVGVSGLMFHVGPSPAAGTFSIHAFNPAGAASDPTNYGINFVAYGDQ